MPEKILIDVELGTAGVARGLSQMESLLTSGAASIASALDAIFAAGNKPGQVAAGLAGLGPAGIAATQPVVQAVEAGRSAGFSDAQIRASVLSHIRSLGILNEQGLPITRQAEVIVTDRLLAIANQELANRAALAAESTKLVNLTSAEVAAAQQLEAQRSLQSAIYREQISKGADLITANARAVSLTEELVQAQRALVVNVKETDVAEGRVLEATRSLATAADERAAANRKGTAADLETSAAGTGRARLDAAIGGLAARIEQLTAQDFTGEALGKQLTEVTSRLGAVLNEEHLAHRDALSLQGEYRLALARALETTNLSSGEQLALAEQLNRLAFASSGAFGNDVLAITRRQDSALEKNPRAKIVELDQAYAQLQEKQIAKKEAEAEAEANISISTKTMEALQKRREALLDAAVRAQAEENVAVEELSQRQHQLDVILGAEVTSEEEKLGAIQAVTAAQLELATHKVATNRALVALDQLTVGAETEYLEATRLLVLDQQRIVGVARGAFEKAGVPINAGTATDADLERREVARKALEAAQAELDVLVTRAGRARDAANAEAEANARAVAQAETLIEARGAELTSAEQRVLLSRNQNAAIEAEYRKQLVALQAIYATTDPRLLASKVDPIFAVKATSRAEAGVNEAQANLTGLQARGATDAEIAAAQKTLTTAYARYAAAMERRTEIMERDVTSYLDPQRALTNNRISSLQDEVEATFKERIALGEAEVVQLRESGAAAADVIGAEKRLAIVKREVLEFESAQAAVRKATYESLNAVDRAAIDNHRREEAARAAAAESVAARYAEDAAQPVRGRVPGGFALRPDAPIDKPDTTQQSINDIRARNEEQALLAERGLSTEADRVAADTEFAKQRGGVESQRLAAATRALHGETAEAAVDEEILAKKKARADLVDIGPGRLGRLIQGEAEASVFAPGFRAPGEVGPPAPRELTGAQAQARIAAEAQLAQEDAAVSARHAASAFEAQATRTEAVVGDEANYQVELAALTQRGTELNAANARLLAANEELEAALAAERTAVRGATAAEESRAGIGQTVAEAQAAQAEAAAQLASVTKESASLRGEATAAEVQSVAAETQARVKQLASIIEETGYTQQSIRSRSLYGRQLDEAQLSEIQAVNLAAVRKRAQADLRIQGAAVNLGRASVDEPFPVDESATTAERVRIAKQLEAELKVQLDAVAKATAKAAELAEITARSVDSAAARTVAEDNANFEALKVVQANEDKVITQRAINEALLSQLRSAEVITATGLTYSELLGETVVVQKLINTEKQAAELNALKTIPGAATGIVGGETAKAQEAAILAEERASTTALIEANAAVTVQRKAQAAREEALILSDEDYIKSQASLIVAQQRYKVLLDEEILAQGGAVAGGGGGRSGGRPPGFLGGFLGRFGFNNDNPEGDVGGAFGGSLAQQAKFFIPFTLAFGSYRQIKEAIKDAEELEKVLAITKQQFDDLGRGAEFDRFRQSILSIARDTGVAASEVALVAQQLIAAFGGDTSRGLRETQSAMEAVRISGLSGAQVVNDFTAIIKSFGDSSTSVRQLTDSAVGLQERFGVLVKDTIEFAGAIAPIAAETGFTAKQIEALGAAYQEFSGRAGSAGAEQLGRVLSGIQDKSVKLVEFLQSNLPDVAGSVASSLSSGDIEQVFEKLLSNYSRLSTAQQEQLLATIGSRRETAALAAIFKDSTNVLRELQGGTDDSGKAAQAFANTQQTLQQQTAELGRAFKDVGIAIYDAGLADILKAIIGDINLLISGVSSLVDFFQALNDASHGAVGQLAQVAAQVLLLAKAIELLRGLALAQGLTSLLTAGAVEAGAGGGLLGAAGAAGGSLNVFRSLGAGGAAFSAARAGAPAIGEQLTFAGMEAEGAAGGAGFLSAFGSGFSAAFAAAPVGWILLGGVAAKTFVDKFDEGVRNSIAASNSKILGHPGAPTSPVEADKLLQTFELTPTDTSQPGNRGPRIDTAEKLRQFLARSDYDLLKNDLETQASEFQQIINGEDQQKKLDRLKQAAQAVNIAATAAVEKIVNDPKKVDALLRELQKSGQYDTLFGHGTSFEDATKQLNQLLVDSQQAAGDPDKLGAGNQKLSILGGLAPGVGTNVDSATAQALKEAKFASERDALVASDAQALKAQLDQGLIGLGEYLDGLDKLQTSLDKLAADGSPLQVDAAEKNRALRSKATSDALRAQADFLREAADIAGRGSPQGDVQGLTNLLNDPGFTDKADRLKAVKDLVTAIKAEKAYEASLVTDAQQKAAILNSVSSLPQEAQSVLYEEFLNTNVAFQTFLHSYFTGQTELAKNIVTLTAQQLSAGVKSLRDAHVNAVEAEINLKTQELILLNGISVYIRDPEAIARVLSELDSLYRDLAAATAPGSTSVPDITIPDFSTVGASPADKAAATKAAADQARQDAKRLRDAKRAYALALAGGDPVKQAQIAQQAADATLADAQTDPSLNAAQRQAAILEAEAQRITADHQLEDVFANIQKAKSNLLIATLNAAGKTVEAAQEAAAQAARDLAKAQADTAAGHGPGEAALADLESNAVTTAANARETALQDKISHEKFLLDVGRVTKGQYIAFLQTLLTDPTLIQKDREQIEREIYQLKNQLGQDFKYNLPTKLDLPTLYEARRTNQTAGAFAGFGSGNAYDNRVYSIIINTAATDPQAIANLVGSVVGDPRAFSSGTKRYP